MDCYYNRKDFMASHVLSNIINIVMATLARGVRRGKKSLINPDQLGRVS